MNRIALVIVTLAVASAGCGGDGSGVGGAVLTPEDLIAAADRTVEEGSAQLDSTFSMDAMPGLGRGLEFGAETEADLSGSRQRTTIELPLALVGGAAAGAETQDMEMIVDASIVHLSMPFASETLEAPTPWIRMDLERLPPGAEVFQSVATGQNDPSQVLNYLRGGTGDFRRSGQEEVRGVATTRYEGTVDLDLAAERAPEEVRERVAASRSNVEAQTGTTEIPTVVWLDEAGLVRRVQYDYSLPTQLVEQAPQGALTLTTDLFDFGVEVDVTPPSNDQVTPIEELIPAA